MTCLRGPGRGLPSPPRPARRGLIVCAPARAAARLVGSLAALALLAACGGEPAHEPAASAGAVPDPLVVGLVPNIAPDEQRARYEPLKEHLEDTLGVDVELSVASDYAGVVTAMAAERLDVAYFGGLTYAQAEQQVDVTPLVTEVDRETGTSTYVSAIVVRDDSPYETLGDVLDGQGRFAMGDVASTSGSLYPRIMLVEAGAECDSRRLTDCPPLEAVDFTGGHDAAAQAVLSGRADAAGVERRILNRLIRDGEIAEGALRVIEERAVEGYPWVARSALGGQAHEAITEAFLAIDDPGLLDLLRAESYVAVGPSDYDEVRERALELGLLQRGDT